MIRVVTPSRLHFGLLNPASGGGRRFGGAGLMIEQPCLALEIATAESWGVEGMLAARAESVLDSFRQGKAWLLRGLAPHSVRITQAAPEHAGLGTGTQLTLALARGLLEAIPHHGVELDRFTGRGYRSGIGYHGFFKGGFLVDGGKYSGHFGVAPLVVRHDFPTEWRIVLVIPRDGKGCHGEAERMLFGHLPALPPDFRNAQGARLLLDVLPALIERDCQAFGAFLHEYNRAAGEPFRDLQGGSYASPEIEWLIEKIRGLGIPGAGQSSWGPTVFAITQDEEQAAWLVGRLRLDATLNNHDLLITRAQNHGACVTVD